MKTIITFLLILSSCTIYSQKTIERILLSNGKTIIIKDNFTWSYDKKSASNSNNRKPYGITSSNLSVNNRSNNISHKKKNTISKKISYNTKRKYNSSYSGYCGALTKKGGSCRRKVSGGGRCWQH